MQKKLILSAVESHYSYSRVFSVVSQHKADHVSRHFQDRSESLLCKETFQNICQEWGHSNIDPSTTRIFYQVPAYMSWKLGPESKVTDAYQQRWYHLHPFAFLVFVLKQVRFWTRREKVLSEASKVNMILIIPFWKTQPWYRQILEISITNPVLLLIFPKLPVFLKLPLKNTSLFSVVYDKSNSVKEINNDSWKISHWAYGKWASTRTLSNNLISKFFHTKWLKPITQH